MVLFLLYHKTIFLSRGGKTAFRIICCFFMESAGAKLVFLRIRSYAVPENKLLKGEKTMRFRFLGTAAAEGFPALWCECPTCAQAEKNGGKDIRRRASYLIDDDTMVDFGPDVFWQTREFGINLRKIRRILFTHPHEDHLNPVELIWRRSPRYSCVNHSIKVFGSGIVFGRIISVCGELEGIYRLEDLNVEPVELRNGESLADGNLTILPLEANHAPGKFAQIFLLERGGKSVLIANDTGWLPEASWELLKGKKLDMVALDSTMGSRVPDADRGHMGINTVVKTVEHLKAIGAAGPETKFFATHFSHNGGYLHADFETFFAPHGIRVAYDGLDVEV